MYTEFYKLSHLPFQLTPDARFFFESSVHRQAMSYLVYGLHHAEGFIVITGEVGAGKTMLVENLLSTIDESEFVIAKIVTTQLAGDHRLRLANWQGDPSLSDDCFPLIYKFTGGVPRRINTLCSRLLLYGFLEELHSLSGTAVDQVGRDLERELAFVRGDHVNSGGNSHS